MAWSGRIVRSYVIQKAQMTSPKMYALMTFHTVCRCLPNLYVQVTTLRDKTAAETPYRLLVPAAALGARRSCPQEVCSLGWHSITQPGAVLAGTAAHSQASKAPAFRKALHLARDISTLAHKASSIPRLLWAIPQHLAQIGAALPSLGWVPVFTPHGLRQT